MWDDITYPFPISTIPNINGWAAEVWESISNFAPHYITDVITYSCWDYSWSILVNGVPGNYCYRLWWWGRSSDGGGKVDMFIIHKISDMLGIHVPKTNTVMLKCLGVKNHGFFFSKYPYVLHTLKVCTQRLTGCAITQMTHSTGYRSGNTWMSIPTPMNMPMGPYISWTRDGLGNGLERSRINTENRLYELMMTHDRDAYILFYHFIRILCVLLLLVLT